jgi:anti-anti-sigma factor
LTIHEEPSSARASGPRAGLLFSDCNAVHSILIKEIPMVTDTPSQDSPAAKLLRAPEAVFECRVAETPWGVLLRLEGEAGVHAVDRMQFILIRLVARRTPLVVVDLSGVTFLSSLAIGALVGLRRDLGRWGGRVKLAAIPPMIYESLKTSRLDMLFEVCATVEEAQAATE